MFGPAFSQFNFGSMRSRMQAPIVIQAIPGYRIKQITLTDAQLQALDVTPVTVCPAEPGRVLYPLSWWLRTLKTGAAAWTASPAMKLVYQGDTQTIANPNLSPTLNTAAAMNLFIPGPGINSATMNLLTFNRIGKAIQVQFASAPTKGAGSSATVDVSVTYYSLPLTF